MTAYNLFSNRIAKSSCCCAWSNGDWCFHNKSWGAGQR